MTKPVKDRHVYLEDIPLDEAQARLQAALATANRDAPLPGEEVPLTAALGRVASQPVWAKISAPHYHASAMDGYAVTAADTLDATETRAVTLKLGEQAVPVNTGAPMPPDKNAVIMIEHVQHPDDDHISIVAPVAPWQHVRMLGEDMVATELVLPANHVIRPVDLGAIAGCGNATVTVRRKPRVVLIPTGSELVAASDNPQPGEIIEYNSLVLAAQIEENGGEAHVAEIVPDAREKLVGALEWALDQQPDLVLMLSGSSAGSKDFTASIIRDLGELHVHGIAVRPGHPVIIGSVEETPVIGVPGYPVSAALTGEIFVQPLIARWLGVLPPPKPTVAATITRKLMSPTGDDDFVRVAVAQVGSRTLATPIAKGAGVITSLVRADGLAHVPRFSEGVDIGDEVTVALYRDVEKAVQITGSHDPMLDLLGQHLATMFPGQRLTSANVGSLGGLVALRRDEAHLAGVHLLDETTGEYNVSYLGRQLRGRALRLVTFAHREQGLIVQKGNPQNVQSLDDLPHVRYVNRQRGAGTRLLLDYELKQRGIAAEDVQGYAREEYTHLAVAAAVATGIADAGLGVRSAAIALNLDFVPVGWERFDLVIPAEHTERVHPLLAALRSDGFKQALGAQPGYDTRETGTLQHEQS